MNVELPDGTVVEDVPDGISKRELAVRLKNNGMQVPNEWFAIDVQPPQKIGMARDEGAATALGETALSLATGTLATPLAGIAGLGRLARGEGLDEAVEAYDFWQDQLTYAPRSQGGQGLTGAVAWPFQKVEQGTDWVGGQVTDVTGSPALGAGAKVGLNFLPQIIGKGLQLRSRLAAERGLRQMSKQAGRVEPGMAEAPTLPARGGRLPVQMPSGQDGVPLRGIARDLMGSALKPTIQQWRNGEAATAINTMLEKGYNATPKGVEKIRARIDDLNVEIKSKIANSPQTIDKAKVLRLLDDLTDQFKKQVNPQADVAAINKVWREFNEHPLLGDQIPVPLAQELKQGTYQQLRKKYGQLGSAEVEAQKALARGLKEQIAQKVPDIAALNAEESRLIKTLSVAERRALMDINKNPGGLAWLSANPYTWAAFMADKSAAFKSLTARALYSGVGPALKATPKAAGLSLKLVPALGLRPELEEMAEEGK